ncbi:MAG: S9 family peptidase [Candidatus Latescibacterota bacterium]|jgi:dipeptidyl aminopeptidase/acylaminoacyl peptidase
MMKTTFTITMAVILLLVAAPPQADEAGKRALTIADLYALKNVADPQCSPDGKRVAFTVTEHDMQEGKSNSDIYLMDVDGSNLRRMTSNEKADYHPRWSPDGKYLLFVSTRENGAQAWRLPVGGGEAEQLTDFSMEVSDPRWTPDGKKILFFTEVYPECGADDGCNKELSEATDEGPVHAHLADDLMYRHWTFYKDGKKFHTLIYDIETKDYTDLTPGQLDAPYYITGGANAGWDISPDGKELCVSSNADPNHWETTNKDLFLVPIVGGEMQNITGDNKAFDGKPHYSPDGRYIAYIVQSVPTYEADLFSIALYDRQTGEKRVLTADFDYWVDDIHWARDSKKIYFTAEIAGVNPLHEVEVKNGKIKKLADLRTIDSFDISPDGKRVFASSRAIAQPQEIWSAKTNGKNVERLTWFNKAVEDEVDIRPAEEHWVESPSGKKIQTWVVKPHGFDPNKKYPFILNVHGGPQGMWWDSFRGDWQVYPGAGYVIAFPNPHGSSGFGQQFTLEISRDWAGKVYDDVMAVTDYMAGQPYVDEDRMGAMGWSYGGYMMMWFEGHTDRFKAIVSMMGVYDLPAMWGSTEELWFPQFDLGGAPWESEDYTKLSPHNYADRFKTPCLVITGEKDYRVPYTQSLEFFTALQKRGVPSRLIVFENDGHWPSWTRSMPLYYNAHLEWFHEYLGGDPAPWDSREMVRNRAYKESSD